MCIPHFPYNSRPQLPHVDGTTAAPFNELDIEQGVEQGTDSEPSLSIPTIPTIPTTEETPL